MEAAATLGSEDRLVLLSISMGRAALVDKLRSGSYENTGSGPAKLLVSPVVSITFRGTDGWKIPMPSLVKPIKIRLSTTSEMSEAALCSFWDEENVTWSSRGLSRLSFEDGELLCQMTHLTIFGAVVDAFLRVVQCSTASEVFSAEGFQNIGKGAWLRFTPSIVTCSAARAAMQTRRRNGQRCIFCVDQPRLCVRFCS